MNDLQATAIARCYRLRARVYTDARGLFLKTFEQAAASALPFGVPQAEEFVTVSRRRVLRGIHFQVPPRDQDKLVLCLSGTVLDVVLDLRVGSASYGKHESFELSGEAGDMVFLPRGLGHAFYVTSESATLAYKVSCAYSPECDTGIHWASAGISWPDAEPVLSARDSALPPFRTFHSPFRYEDT